MRGPAASQLPGSTGSGGWRSVGRSLQLCPSPPTPTVPSLFFRAQFSEMEKGQLGLSGSERADGAVGTLGERETVAVREGPLAWAPPRPPRREERGARGPTQFCPLLGGLGGPHPCSGPQFSQIVQMIKIPSAQPL